jgi:exosortase/archaeosortase family protein
LLANAVRITLLTAIGTSVSAGVAVGGFHSQAGWLFVLAVWITLTVPVVEELAFRGDLIRMLVSPALEMPT